MTRAAAISDAAILARERAENGARFDAATLPAPGARVALSRHLGAAIATPIDCAHSAPCSHRWEL